MSRVTSTVNFSRLSAAIQLRVKEIVEVNTGDMEMEAIRNAPGPGAMVATEHGPVSESDIRNGRWTPISQAIGYRIENSGYTGKVFVERSAGDIAAWCEFGTGQSAATYLATVPSKWREIAARYIRNKRGTIVNQPYMLPAFYKYSVIFRKQLKEALRNVRG